MITGIVICAAVFLFSGAMLIREFLEQKQSADAFAQVAELVMRTISPVLKALIRRKKRLLKSIPRCTPKTMISSAG